ncbi:glucosamine-6-phosphate deaminase [Clostridium botulinum]|uniref:Glucosamine-6-phosphate deaminase n=1 Tax=Clostridium botulinum (strain Eklund 17B / Type B) TaxID=935198 RepID=NAGB_CLOBB|nr:RecName: Full=Glucosamine-6-phosphate deaminase; AltName: Full=GlcN6P deaminase; Short=GNPDA; AltName: Full=Glucosamine-6-phosphate isomerase [Clostridium botulinum B str. Eklund 17B (NRP)]MBY6976587.1 glucosamine-6-phosphate deaminase [Clostridium botulinum]ACD24826.1 glucosamine-6-phosphate deaminase [Clostridium botulinum B str. Eklund 17B (NRP)]MBY7001480.1 glucosamine-6-phosphate deaminase [Clostridium botulinum]MCR1274317.1 glucosamine-6-phosphate deaminase [Clostridium botulinum]NFD6
MKILVCENYDKLSEKAAQIIMSQITLKSNSILGLATGSTPIGMYKKLVEMYENKMIDFSDVKTFNLDEYQNLPISNDQSYHYFMDDNLFNYINVKRENIYIPNGMANDIENECIKYDNLIKEAGGIDIQVLGIGNNAHIGFNEPTVNFEKKTYVVELEESTKIANARFFNSLDEVPSKAITMGIGSIFESKKIMLLATGENKAKAIYDTIYGKVTPEVPASILQFHDDLIVILDKEAASLLNPKDYKVV